VNLRATAEWVMKPHARFVPEAERPARPGGEPDFAQEVLAGLANLPKRTPGRWLHDAAGAALFDAVTRLPEYYLVRTECLILQRCAAEIAALAGAGASVLEAGPASAARTQLLLAALDRPACHALVCPVVADFARLARVPQRAQPGARVLVFLPGSAIGGLEPHDAVALLRHAGRIAGASGVLVLGADATQDPSALLPAYDDPQGVNAAFNKNLLVRMNRELDADFDIGAFRHAARFDTRQRRVEMHLVSRCEQWVRVAGRRIHFDQGESIHTDSAYKHGLLRIQSIASGAGWSQRQMWTDAGARFGVHVFERMA
jgi:L-histidine Nalpha-methyltransferase